MIIRKDLPELKPDFQAGLIILVDKPLTWTSFDVVNYIRFPISRLLGIKRVKIGHAGTLDPLASGLLILCVGKFTKRIEEFRSLTKRYQAEFTFGSTTPSFDLETEIDQEYPFEHINHDLLIEKSQLMLGESQQIPPIYSAKKVGGKRAYEFARADQEVILKPKTVTISDFKLNGYQDNKAEFDIECSTGTYIRAIARDIGEELNSGAHLSFLRRTSIGDFHVDDAHSPQEIKQWVTNFDNTNP